MGIEEHVADYGVAITAIIGGVVIMRMLVTAGIQIVGIWQDVAAERRKVDAKIAETMDGIAATLRTLNRDSNETKELVSGARREHTTIIGTLSSSEHGLEALSRKIEGLPRKTAASVRQELTTDLEAIRSAAMGVTLSIDNLVTKIEALPLNNSERKASSGHGDCHDKTAAEPAAGEAAQKPDADAEKEQ